MKSRTDSTFPKDDAPRPAPRRLTTRRFYKTRLHPFRLLVLLCWGNYSYLRRFGDRMVVEPRPLTQLLRVSHGRLVSHMEWLAKYGYLRDFSYAHGVFRFEVVRPTHWNPKPPMLVDEIEWEDETGD